MGQREKVLAWLRSVNTCHRDKGKFIICFWSRIERYWWLLLRVIWKSVWMMKLQFLSWTTSSLEWAFFSFEVLQRGLLLNPFLYLFQLFIFQECIKSCCWRTTFILVALERIKIRFIMYGSAVGKKNNNKTKNTFCYGPFINQLFFFFLNYSVCAWHMPVSGLPTMNMVDIMYACMGFTSKYRPAQRHFSI